jgi:hypothetical protein
MMEGDGDTALGERPIMRAGILVRKIFARLFFVAFVVVVSLTAFEVVLRIIGYRPSATIYDYVLPFDERILFSIEPNCTADINSMGYRGSDPGEKARFVKRVLVLGDSFIMGHNVQPGETLPAELGKSLGGGFEVFNMGVLAYGPDQSLVSLLDDGLALDPDMVVLGIFAANDFQDLDRNRLFSFDAGGMLQRNSENPVTDYVPRFRAFFVLNHLQWVLQPYVDPNHRFLARNHEFLRHNLFEDFYDIEMVVDPGSDISRRRIDLMRGVLARFVTETRSRGINFSVVIIPSFFNVVSPVEFLHAGVTTEQVEDLENGPDGFFGPENRVREICEELRIAYLNLYPEFMALDEDGRAALYDPADWHLSAHGNRAAGNLVADALVRPELPYLQSISKRPGQQRKPWL